MQFLRKLLLVLIAPIFTIVLYVTAIDVGFVHTASQPTTIKKILSDSGIYTSVVSGLLDQSKHVSNGGKDVSLSDPVVRDAAEKTFSPQFIQKNTETVIDSTYRWLDGKTPLPDFQIDLTPVKADFATNVAQGLADKLAKLPACTGAVDLSSFDAQTAACLPRGVNPTSEVASVKNDILSGKGFLDHPVITADSIKSKAGGPSVFADKLKKAPDSYQKAKKTPAALMALTALLAVAIIFISTSRRKGIRRVGITMLSVGIFMLVFAWGVNKAINQKLIPSIKFDNVVLQDKVKTLVKDATKEIDKTYWQFGIGYTVIGAGAIAGAMFIKRGGKNGDDDLEGEGKTKEDRIDLKEPDKAISLPDSKDPSDKPQSAAKKPAAAKPTAPAKPRKISIQ